MKISWFYSLALGALLTVPVLAADGFTPIFNGNNLDGWEGDPKLWSARDGVIVGRTTAENPLKANTFLIWTNGEVADFELRCSFRITPNNNEGFANSGIQYRSKILNRTGWVVGGYQADMEAGPNYTGILYDEQGGAGNRGIMALRGEKVVWDADGKKQVTGSLGDSAEIQAAIKPGAWNDYTIIARGNHLQHFVNGRLTVDVTDNCADKALHSGVVALQLHAGSPMTVEFKDLRIKSLTDDLATLSGTWIVTDVKADDVGTLKDDFEKLTITIKGKQYTTEKYGQGDVGTIALDASQTPKRLDIYPDTGPGAGRLIPAIYELSGENLRIRFSTQDGAGRPANFSGSPDFGEAIITCRRK
ncbi:MAG: DUF1080 domain-containing protein [Verrucomicrobiae bacterium]|nr:DUF1080 domain-containing protein [Verrucomicrobiae bacterium]